jgi:hypothetical protein
MIRRLLLLTILAASACSLTAANDPLQLPTATTVRVIPGTLVPTVQRQVNAIPTATADPVTPDACQGSAGQPTTRHIVAANLNYTQRGMVVNHTIEYTNRANVALQYIVLSVEASQWPGAFQLGNVTADGADAGYEITGRRLQIDLPDTLEPGCTIKLDMVFQLTVPPIGGGLTAYRGFLGHSPRQLNLGNWLPMVAPRLDGDWLLREAVLIGEQTVLDVADWDVTLNVSGAPDSLQIAGPGLVTHEAEHTWRFEINGSRDFTLSLSAEFNRTSAQTESGVTVELYSYNDALVHTTEGAAVDGAAHALEVATRSLSMYEDLYGPYPHQRLVIVEGDFPDGMEFSGLVFVSKDWFTRYTGNPAAFLTVITAHEVAHQWWYASVGNDQAMMPWLDEALATYSEYVFFEEYYPELKDWWWSWRVDNYSPQGFVDSSVYQFSSIREYINTVYLLGSRMLHDLRGDLGTDAFFDLLRRYYEAGAGRIVGPDLFWSLLTVDELAATQAVRQRYFRPAGPEQ